MPTTATPVSSDAAPRTSRSVLVLTVQYATRRRRVPNRRQFRQWARLALAVPADVTVRLVDEPEGRALNREYRGKDYATNVLSFAYGGEEAVLRGDLVLCAPVVAREARTHGKPVAAHYAHLTIHGLLHLQGYQHESARGARQMEAREAALLLALGYPNPYDYAVVTAVRSFNDLARVRRRLC